MIRDEYKRAFADILPDPALEARTERMAIEMRMKNTKPARRFSAVLVAAIIFVLAAGIAVAATIQSGILDKLFIYSEPSEAAQEAVIHGGESATDEGVTLAVTEYLMDGNSLHVGWSVSSERDEPVYYITSYEIDDGDAAESQPTGGIYGGNSSSEVGDTVLVQLTPERPSFMGYVGNGYQSVPDVPVKATIRIRAFTTDLTPVSADTWSELHWPEEEDMAACLARADAGEIGVSPEGWSYLGDYPAYQEAAEKLFADYDEENDPHYRIAERIREDALIESGLMRELTELSVTVTVPVQTSDPSTSVSAGECEFTFPDRRVVVREFSMDVASTVITYDVYPTVDIDYSEGWFVRGGWYYIPFDPDGHPLNVELGLGMIYTGNSGEREANEPLYFRTICSGNPATEIPEYVTFVPVCQLEREEGENSFDYYQRMAALADPADCFQVNLTGGE